jgi:nitrate reductase (NAD(P)H)
MNHYHIWDNRVLPSFVDSKATLVARALFHHPETACNEQALQSIICVPAHGQALTLPTGEDALDQQFVVKGLAYHGGGIAVQRVELSADGGKTWK